MLAAVDRPPLRQRRRAAVEQIALDLASTRGYDAVTVELICEKALIAPSTFFNYFGSKETAVLGPAPRSLDEARLAAYERGTGDRLTELMSMLLADWPQTPEERAVLLQRLDVIDRTPSLSAAHHGRLEIASAQVERATRARLRREGVPDAAGDARMVVAVSHALMHWMIGHLRVEPSIAFDELIDQAIRTLRVVSGLRA